MVKKIIVFLLCLAVPLGLEAWAGIVTSANIASWFETLKAPFFRPPNWVFAPVWTALYILMGISFFMVVTKKTRCSKKFAIGITIAQMVLNTLWSFLFFKFHLLGIALIDILLLWVAILFMIRTFYRLNTIAALLQIPYLLWVSFATILNAAYFILN